MDLVLTFFETCFSSSSLASLSGTIKEYALVFVSGIVLACCLACLAASIEVRTEDRGNDASRRWLGRAANNRPQALPFCGLILLWLLFVCISMRRGNTSRRSRPTRSHRFGICVPHVAGSLSLCLDLSSRASGQCFDKSPSSLRISNMHRVASEDLKAGHHPVCFLWHVELVEEASERVRQWQRQCVRALLSTGEASGEA